MGGEIAKSSPEKHHHTKTQKIEIDADSKAPTQHNSNGSAISETNNNTKLSRKKEKIVVIAKKQLIVKYTEVSTKVCTEKQDLCAEIKRDVADLKNSLNITWDIIYDIYVEMIKPAGAAGLQKLSDWYKVWKND